MSYDPTLPTEIDKARKRLGDTSDDEATEFLSDEEYEAELLLHADWRLAAAALAMGLASRAIEEPSSFTAVGDFSAGWVNRAAEWRAIAAELRKEVADELAAANQGAGLQVITMPFLDGDPYGEYL